MAKKYIDVSLAPIYLNSEACEQIKYMPDADVQEVVRCKDCMHHNNCEIEIAGQFSDNSFCCYGERKGEENAK